MLSIAYARWAGLLNGDANGEALLIDWHPMAIWFKSPDLKAARGYKEATSYVREDGSEVLKGKDWMKRKRELWARCGGRCEFAIGRNLRCQSEAHDPHHKIERSEHRDDRLSNLIALCRMHHETFDWKKLHWRADEAGKD